MPDFTSGRGKRHAYVSFKSQEAGGFHLFREQVESYELIRAAFAARKAVHRSVIGGTTVTVIHQQPVDLNVIGSEGTRITTARSELKTVC
jgi:hypothetical protein